MPSRQNRTADGDNPDRTKRRKQSWRRRFDRRLRRVEVGMATLTAAVLAPKVELGGTSLTGVIEQLIGKVF